MKDRAGGTVRSALAHRDFRLLLSALAVSTAGDWLYGIALIVFVFEETGSPGWVAAASILRLIPYVLFGTIGGVVADRYERRTVMIASDVARAVLMFALAGVAASSAPVGFALAISFASTMAGTAYSPALAAMTPAVVEERDLAAANAVISTVEHTALVVGPAIGGLLLVLGEPAAAFAVNGVTFLVSGALLLPVATRAPVEASEEELDLRERMMTGLRAIGSSSQVGVLVGCFIVASFIYGQELVLLVLVSENLLSTGSEGVGFLNAAAGVGGVLAAGYTSRIANDPKLARTIAGSILLTGLPLSVLAFVHNPVLAYVLMAIAGAGSIVIDVAVVTMLQRSLRQEVIARVFGILDSIAVAGILVGSLVAPVAVRLFGLEETLVGLGFTLLAIVLLSRRKLKEAESETGARMTELAPRVDILERSGLLEGAPRQVLETLVGVATEERVASGTSVVREGEPADDVFVVVEGALEVTAAGELGTQPVKVSTVEAGDYFGEIGLVERIPRTATVTATKPCVLYRIDGRTFLDIVNERPTSSGTLLDGIVGRLARTHPSYTPKQPVGGD